LFQRAAIERKVMNLLPHQTYNGGVGTIVEVLPDSKNLRRDYLVCRDPGGNRILATAKHDKYHEGDGVDIIRERWHLSIGFLGFHPEDINRLSITPRAPSEKIQLTQQRDLACRG